MKKAELNFQKQSPNFIGSWFMEPTSLCDELIEHFESNFSRHSSGKTGSGSNLEIKDSTDMVIKPKELTLPENEYFLRYFDELNLCNKQYIEQWPFLNCISSNLEIGRFNLQRYLPGQHFKKIHTERSSLETLHRVFAFMTYLNDVDDGGSTYFSHYDLEVKPQKGLTMIWPAEWTHAHRGNILKSGVKYIITGWINFIK